MRLRHFRIVLLPLSLVLCATVKETMDRSFQLKQYGNLIANFKVLETDQPWYICQLDPVREFSKHQEFFNDFESQYKSGQVGDFDTFFRKLPDNGYEMISGLKKSTRFIISFREQQVLVRGSFE